jgi:hypothetical protein
VDSSQLKGPIEWIKSIESSEKPGKIRERDAAVAELFIFCK